MRTLVLLMALLSLFTSISTVAKQQAKIITYKNLGDTKLKLHIFNPADHHVLDRRPVIVFFFGGGWMGGSPKQFYKQSQYLAERGMVAISAEYRVKKKHQTTPKEAVQDAKSAIRWVRTHAADLGIDPSQIIAGGGSAGGHLAAATATLSKFNEPGEDTSISAKPSALVLFNPVYDNGPDGYGYDRVKAYWQDFSPIHNLTKSTPPALVMLGTKDHLIPVATAKTFQKKMQQLGIRSELYLYEGQKHGFFNKAKYAETLHEMDKFLTSLNYISEPKTAE